jgi:hypothetical protein
MSTAQKRFFEKHSIGSSPKMPVRCLLPILDLNALKLAQIQCQYR